MTKIKNFFKSITNSKKKIFALALSVCVVVLSIAGSSIAYFTDTAKITNTFTSGNVDIKLSEAKVTTDGSGNFVKDGTTRIEADGSEGSQAYGSVFPKQTIYKDPTITNIGSEDAYVGAVVTITGTDIDALLSSEALVKNFVTGLPTSGATVKVNIDSENNTITIHVVFTSALESTDEAVVFTGLKMDDAWTNADMTKLNGLKIVVDAYAVQTSGMTSGALAALKDAFDAFDSLS